MPTIRNTLLLALTLCASNLTAADLLTIGSDAPQLNIEHWVQDGNGQFKPVSKFENGKVYVVEFWATWCGPCIQSMPHLAALQKEYAKQGVQIVSISDEDLETVEKFLERPVRGGGHSSEEGREEGEEAEEHTYRQLTSAYCLTTDPDQSSYEDYMVAAAQNGIPTAFIVGKDAKVEWIGHPMEMDGPLSAIVSGSWDREAFAKEMKAKQEAEKMVQDIFALLQEQEFDQALKLIDQTLAKGSNEQLNMLKLQVLLVAEKPDAAAKHLAGLYKEMKDEPEMINMIAWNIYEMAAQGRSKESAILNASIEAAADAATKSEGDAKASVLDTQAHLLFVAGQLDAAIEVETEAVKLSGEESKEFMQNFLLELKEAQKKSEGK